MNSLRHKINLSNMYNAIVNTIPRNELASSNPTSRLTLKTFFYWKSQKQSKQYNRMYNVRKGNKKAYFLGIVTNLRSILRWRRKSSDGWNSIENSPFEKNVSKQLSTRPRGHSPNLTSTQQKESTKHLKE